MSKYILELEHKKDPQNNMTIECVSAQEAIKYRDKALKQGYLVTVTKGGTK